MKQNCVCFNLDTVNTISNTIEKGFWDNGGANQLVQNAFVAWLGLDEYIKQSIKKRIFQNSMNMIWLNEGI